MSPSRGKLVSEFNSGCDQRACPTVVSDTDPNGEPTVFHQGREGRLLAWTPNEGDAEFLEAAHGSVCRELCIWYKFIYIQPRTVKRFDATIT